MLWPVVWSSLKNMPYLQSHTAAAFSSAQSAAGPPKAKCSPPVPYVAGQGHSGRVHVRLHYPDVPLSRVMRLITI